VGNRTGNLTPLQEQAAVATPIAERLTTLRMVRFKPLPAGRAPNCSVELSKVHLVESITKQNILVLFPFGRHTINDFWQIVAEERQRPRRRFFGSQYIGKTQ
jgi:hypothetical protein